MGPIILLDKSTLQSLSAYELEALYRHYFVNISHILLVEIICDLYNKKDYSKIEYEKVQLLANKLQPINSIINDNHRMLMVESLLGNNVEMSYHPIVKSNYPIIDKNEEKGFIKFPSKLELELDRWKEGNFTKKEEETAKLWKNNYSKFDLNEFVIKFKNNNPTIPQFNSVYEVLLSIQNKINDESNQYSNLQHFMQTQGFDFDIIQQINNRWLENNFFSMESFSPYCFFCYKVDLLFRICVVNNLITPKQTQIIDLQYLYYLPFCQVFSSGDNFHKLMIDYILNGNQSFVQRDNLKSDLQKLNNWWNSLSEDEKINWDKIYGKRPPQDNSSITTKMWEKHVGPWTQLEGNRVYDMTEEDKRNEVQRINNIMKNAK